MEPATRSSTSTQFIYAVNRDYKNVWVSFAAKYWDVFAIREGATPMNW
jgi:hypothetical protein